MSTIVVYLPIAVEVDFDYQPAEPPDCGPEARYPGCAESAEINAVRVGDLDITEQLDHDDFASLETIILESHDGY